MGLLARTAWGSVTVRRRMLPQYWVVGRPRTRSTRKTVTDCTSRDLACRSVLSVHQRTAPHDTLPDRSPPRHRVIERRCTGRAEVRWGRMGYGPGPALLPVLGLSSDRVSARGPSGPSRPVGSYAPRGRPQTVPHPPLGTDRPARPRPKGGAAQSNGPVNAAGALDPKRSPAEQGRIAAGRSTRGRFGTPRPRRSDHCGTSPSPILEIGSSRPPRPNPLEIPRPDGARATCWRPSRSSSSSLHSSFRS